jgi:hypothetical protein
MDNHLGNLIWRAQAPRRRGTLPDVLLRSRRFLRGRSGETGMVLRLRAGNTEGNGSDEFE